MKLCRYGIGGAGKGLASGLEIDAPVIECSPTKQEVLRPSPNTMETGCGGAHWEPSTQKVEAGSSISQDRPHLHTKSGVLGGRLWMVLR